MHHVERKAVLEAAEGWCGTPYHHRAMVKGAGVDCLYFIYAAYLEAGLIEPVEIPDYSPQWLLHRGDETYLQGLLQYAHEVAEPLPADVVMYKWGRVYSHSALVAAEGWPCIIHAAAEAGVVMHDEGLGGRLADCPRKYFSFWDN